MLMTHWRGSLRIQRKRLLPDTVNFYDGQGDVRAKKWIDKGSRAVSYTLHNFRLRVEKL
jgi:hypothetical protein